MSKLENIVKFLKALSGSVRLKIVCLLYSKKDLCVCEIKEIIGLSQPTISSHLKVLDNAGIVISRKDGRWVNYNINPGLDEELKEIINNIVTIFK